MKKGAASETSLAETLRSFLEGPLKRAKQIVEELISPTKPI